MVSGWGLGRAGAADRLDPQDNLRFIADLDISGHDLASSIESGSIAATGIREGMSLLSSGGRRSLQTAFAADGQRSITSPLKRALGALEGEFDFILFDCPPEFGRMTSAALSLSDYLLIPCVSTWLGLRSIEQMVNFVDTHTRDARIDSDRTGIVMTFYTTRRAGPEPVRQEAKKMFRNRLLRTVIRERTSSIIRRKRTRACSNIRRAATAQEIMPRSRKKS